MEVGLIKTIDIDKEMQQSYLDYAMSVIVSRALPDARDGLKPVHRRILYALHDMGLRPSGTHKKSARIVGEVLGKYHPHGDAAVYDAMARMVQVFSMRYPLVDGQGNFGSIDGDPPAAMRYTEAKMAEAAVNMLADIQKETVEFLPNFDDSLSEPSVLPAAIPNLLVNGATGIAVGMSTSVPPHNLEEIVSALNYLLSRWGKIDDVSVDDLMQFVKGPDFPTGGVIIGEEENTALKTAYGSGRGRITVQARVHLEEAARGRSRIIVTELPYMTNKAGLIERIANLTREGRLEGLSDLRDESARDEMRIVIEISKGTDPDQILRELFQRTPMQGTFSIIILALVDGEPRLLSLKQALKVYIEHRLDIIKRRTEFDLKKARDRAHILEGLRTALKNLDEVIGLIRRSPDVETARTRLRRKYKLSDVQADAILNMPLRRLASLERKKIEQEYKEMLRQIKDLEGLLRSPKRMRTTISEELLAVKETYGDRRRTQIVSLDQGETRKTAVLTARDLAPDKDVWVTVLEDGTIARSLTAKPPRLSGTTAPSWLLKVNTRDTLYLVCEDGEAVSFGVHALPEVEKPVDGTPYHQITPLRSDDLLAAVINLPPKGERPEGWYITTVSRGGMIKKSEVVSFPGPTAQKFTFVRINDGDRLGWAHISNGSNEILMATSQGMAIRFHEEEVRPMGLVAAGVMGIKLRVGDEVVGSRLLPVEGEIFLIRSDGIAKRVKVNDFPKQGRYGQGVVAWKLPSGARLAGMTGGKTTTRVIVHLYRLTAKALRLDSAPIRGRPANGSRVVTLKAGDQVTHITEMEVSKRPQAEKKPPKKRTRKRAAKSRAKSSKR